MRKLLLTLLLLLCLPVAYVGVVSNLTTDPASLPPLESGDLVFETTLTDQTPAILLATGSLYTHVGVVHKQKEGYTVIQAMRRVAETPLEDFIRSGWGGRITILRYPGLNEGQKEMIVRNAESYIGRDYNYVFYMNSKNLYCSEVPYFAFKETGLPLGKLEKIGDLFVNNSAVHKIFDTRWRSHPACQAPGTNATACWNIVMNEPIITPVSLARDSRLVRIYSNYLF